MAAAAAAAAQATLTLPDPVLHGTMDSKNHLVTNCSLIYKLTHKP
jgi:hypothetical protein